MSKRGNNIASTMNNPRVPKFPSKGLSPNKNQISISCGKSAGQDNFLSILTNFFHFVLDTSHLFHLQR